MTKSPLTQAATPITIVAGPDWIPLKMDLEIEPNSALDFSARGFLNGPAGKYGRVSARPDGQFAFEKTPNISRRFYGVNFCFSALYLTHQEADQLGDRLARLGYNTVRVHHYERDLVTGERNSLTFNPEKLDQLDYLLAALSRRGFYWTTDLFVSRPVMPGDIGIEGTEPIEMNKFKLLVPVHEGAWNNWKAFTKKLLDHVNPYTKLRYADDPALAWLSMINEGNFGNHFSLLRSIPEWKSAWNKWLRTEYPGRRSIEADWGSELSSSEDPSNRSVEFPDTLTGDKPRVRDCIAFLSYRERDMVERMKAFIRNELGCKALITNSNGWTNHITDQAARSTYDYVDDHFYIDHPQFLETKWQLPSFSKNTSPIAGGASGGRHTSFTRLLNKPFTITEYDYSSPGRFRGVGGILTGALGALQAWGGIWRFAYSHNRQSLFQPARINYFDLVCDPLNQAAERAALLLYLRGDMKPAPHSIALAMTTRDLDSPPALIPKLAPTWHWLAWITRVGTIVVSDPASTLPYTAVLPLGWADPPTTYTHANAKSDIRAYALRSEELKQMLNEAGLLHKGNPTDAENSIFKSETGAILIDGPRDIMVLDTPKTAGGYAPAGQTITTSDGKLSITMRDTDATVWASALDDRSITKSKRLLVTHLTDVQNTNIKYAEEARQTLLDWGTLPHLVRNGKAGIRMQIQDAKKFKVWALATSGKRMGRVPAVAKGNILEFTVHVAGGTQNGGAQLLYEIAQR